MIEIIPAILPESLDDLREKMSRVSGLVSLVQIDICDGRFVSHESWPYTDGGEEEFDRLVSEEDGFPFWDSLDIEVDLMLKKPESVIDRWIKVGARRLIIHLNSTADLKGLVEKIRADYGSRHDSEYGIELGIGVHIEDELNLVYELLEDLDSNGYPIIDFVQFMGIERVGFQGQEFDDRVLEKISDLRDHYAEIPISVDGGVNFDNASDLISAGATRLVSGSAIFESDDIVQAIHDLQANNE